MLDVRIAHGARELTPELFLNRFSPVIAKMEISDTIKTLIDILDDLDGDCDFEDDDSDRCAAGDDEICSGPISEMGLLFRDYPPGNEDDA